jgi:hypothetical protein
MPGCATHPIRAVSDAATTHVQENSYECPPSEKNDAGSASCSTRNPPSLCRPKGSNSSDMRTMSGPWIVSVMTVARSPPAKPYETKITVITRIAQTSMFSPYTRVSLARPPPTIALNNVAVLFRISPIDTDILIRRSPSRAPRATRLTGSGKNPRW